MSTLTLTIKLDNEAFQGNTVAEVNRILRTYVTFNSLAETVQERTLLDVNGNKVGKAEVTDE